MVNYGPFFIAYIGVIMCSYQLQNGNARRQQWCVRKPR